MGVNKANYFITRAEKLNLAVSGDKIKRTLTLTLINSANPVLADSGRYKVYVRLLTLPNTQNNSVSIISGSDVSKVIPEIYQIKDHQEMGTLVEVLPGTTKKIVFSWDSDFPLSLSQNGSLRLYLRKQAGISDTPLSVSFNFPGVNIKPPAGFTLTSPGTYVYNTTLTRDLFSRISW